MTLSEAEVWVKPLNICHRERGGMGRNRFRPIWWHYPGDTELRARETPKLYCSKGAEEPQSI